MLKNLHYSASTMTIETYSSRRRRGYSQSIPKPPDIGCVDAPSGSPKKSLIDNRPGKWRLRPRTSTSMRVLGQVKTIIGGICVCFTLYFAWTVVTMFLTLSHNDGRPNTQPTILSQPQVEPFISDNRQWEVEHEKRHMTTTLRGSSSLDKSKQAETSIIGSFGKVVRPPAIPKPIHLYGKTTSWTTREPDYGGLLISPLLAPGVPRVIRDGTADLGDDDGQEFESFDEYYAFDDDIIRGTDGVAEKRYQDDNCRRTQEHRYTFPNCNELHQLDRTNVENDFRFINDGAFREVFSLQTPQDMLAIKEIIFEDVGDEDEYALLEYVRMDAIVAERLTASPRVYDIYGHCALSIASEYFYHGDIEDLSAGEVGFSGSSDEGEHGDELRPNNGLTPAQKLVLALEMAESLADLHGNAAGMIIHDDVQLSQFLLNKDKTILKLNDFNRAEFPLWNGKSYCRYQNGRGPGSWRSPEEYKDLPLTEKIDVWSFGNNLYTILTGRYPFDDEPDNSAKHLVRQGETATIDRRFLHRSKEEKAIVEVIEGCFKYYPHERPTIFEIVEQLQKALHENVEAIGLTREAVLQQINLE